MPGNLYEMELEQDQAFKMSPNVNGRRYVAGGVTFGDDYEDAPKRTQSAHIRKDMKYLKFDNSGNSEDLRKMYSNNMYMKSKVTEEGEEMEQDQESDSELER